MAEYVCEMTDDYQDVPYGSDEYSGTVERWKSGEVVRCADCEHCAFLDDIGLVCCRLPFRFRTGPRMFCSWGEERKAE